LKEKAVEETFEALFALTDLRQIFRETKPLYQLDAEQREKVEAIITRVKLSLKVIEDELLKGGQAE